MIHNRINFILNIKKNTVCVIISCDISEYPNVINENPFITEKSQSLVDSQTAWSGFFIEISTPNADPDNDKAYVKATNLLISD